MLDRPDPRPPDRPASEPLEDGGCDADRDCICDRPYDWTYDRPDHQQALKPMLYHAVSERQIDLGQNIMS